MEPLPGDDELELGVPTTEAPLVRLGQLEEGDLVDSYRFRAVEGDHVYRIEVLPGTVSSADVNLFAVGEEDADEVLVASSNHWGVGLTPSMMLEANRSGIYRLEISGDGPGSYELRVSVLMDDFPGQVDADEPAITEGVMVLGLLETHSDTDVIPLEAMEGEHYELAFSIADRHRGSENLVIVDGDGNETGWLNTSSTRKVWLAPSTGRHYLTVPPRQTVQGSYRPLPPEPLTRYYFKYNMIADDHGDQRDESATPIMVGEVSTGVHEHHLDDDVFVLNATAGTAYEVSFTQGDFEIFDPDGQKMEFVWPMHDRVVDAWNAQITGPHYIMLSPHDKVFVPTPYPRPYEVTISLAADDHPDLVGQSPAKIDLATTVGGALGTLTDADVFALQTLAGQGYRLESSFSPTWAKLRFSVLEGESASLLTEVAQGNQLSWTAAHSGTSYVRVVAHGTPSEYEFQVLEDGGSLEDLGLAASGDPENTPLSARLAFDFSSSGAFDAEDIDLLFSAVRTRSGDVEFDTNGDGEINQVDIDTLFDEQGLLRGDSNLDGRVDFLDFLSLTSRFGRMGGWSDGDSNGDGEVDFADFVSLSMNWSGGNRE